MFSQSQSDEGEVNESNKTVEATRPCDFLQVKRCFDMTGKVALQTIFSELSREAATLQKILNTLKINFPRFSSLFFASADAFEYAL